MLQNQSLRCQLSTNRVRLFTRNPVMHNLSSSASINTCSTNIGTMSLIFFVDQLRRLQNSNRSAFFLCCCFFFLSTAADLDQQDYRTADLPALPLPRGTRRQPTPQEAQEIQRLIRRMLSFEPRQRPSIDEVVAALENFVRRFPMS